MAYSIGSVLDTLMIDIIRKQKDPDQREAFIEIALKDGVVDKVQADALRAEV